MSELYWETHPGEGPCLLLVHGFLSSRAQWRPNLEALGRFARPVVVELWGHGRSGEGPSPEHYHPERYIAEFERIRESLGAERWLVIGQSLGASLTLRYALSHPERVMAQAFTNSNSALADEASFARRREELAGAIDDIDARGLAAVEALRVHPKHAKRLPEAVRDELVADAGLLRPGAVTASYRHLSPRASVRERFHETTVPTMLACGRFEKRFGALRDFAAEALPRLEVVDLDGGHAVNIDAAEAFNQHVERFFRPHIGRA